ncbi:astacin [Teladorsagia circumcincta]|uniref:Metalloendopeptidase n=1 Tax=Teladorsagia circumcincta TaxID=45464 RepID=A0A2G9U950_TELCI|nr:astacin [Teladorsagia circumcincta]
MPLDGCYSYVGKVGGTQVISLAVDCIADYIIWHEVMHAIGFEHEHQRPDRDKFIRVEYINVQQGQLVNFDKLSPHEVDYPDTYDYDSIMHYDSHAFGRKDSSTGARLVTMIPLKKGVILDDNLKMSESDIAKLNRLGNCTVSKGLYSLFLLRASPFDYIEKIGA